MNKYKKVISEAKINAAISKMAEEINKDFGIKEDLVLVIVLTGAVNFGYDLAKHLKMRVGFDFVEATSYSNNQRLSSVKVEPLYTFSLKGKNVLLIEDIIETGGTIKEVIKTLAKQKPKSISLATIFNSKELIGLTKQYVLFKNKPEGFLVGYGFDDNEFCRNWPYISIIKK